MGRRTYTLGIRAQRAVETHARIVAAARALVLDGENPTIDDVAARAGVGRATVFKQHGSRAALLVAVEADAAERAGVYPMVERLLQHPDARAAVRALLLEGVGVWHAERAVFLRFYGDANVDVEMRRVVDDKERARLEVARQFAARLDGAGALRAGVDVERAADALWLLTSFAVYERLLARRLSMAKMGEALVGLARGVAEL